MAKQIQWSSRTAFIFAAAAAAVGLGNIWRFPYLAGQNGGGAFVLTYLFFVLLLGLPLMISEVMIGRLGRKNPAGSMKAVAKLAGRSPHWKWLGGMTVLASFLILSYYTVISGWVLDYFIRAISGHFQHFTRASAAPAFQSLQSHHLRVLADDTLIVLISIGVIMLGIKDGLERTVMLMFPALMVIMLILLVHAATTSHFHQAFLFLFSPDFHSLTAKGVLTALGQAFFSLNIAMGIIIMFSAYMPNKVPIVSSSIVIVIADTVIALLAGLIIFPVVFSNNLPPTAGPSLIFETLPIAFSNIPFGYPIGALFFLLLLFAAFTSCIALLEVTVAWLMETFKTHRRRAVIFAGIILWILSIGTVYSFSHPSYVSFHGITFFKFIDFITAGIMLPVGGMMVAIFTGWCLPKKFIHDKLGWPMQGVWINCWRFIKRYVAPVAIGCILLTSLGII
jgi:NSS family neurotransmitter:Na+ symporter